MKTFTRIIGCALSLAAVVSCTDSFPEQDAADKFVYREFAAAIQTSPTRTGLASGTSVLWDEAGESISIIDAQGGCHTLMQTGVSQDRTLARFAGEVPDQGCEFAVYPAISESDYGNGLLSISIPTVQEPVPDSFATGTNPAISSVSQEGSLYFQNICGIVGFTVNAADVTSIRFSADEVSGGALTGTASVGHDGTVPVCMSELDKGSSYVELAGDIESGTRYFALVYPGTYRNLEVRFTDSKGRTASFTKNGELKVERSGAVNITPFNITENDWTGGELPGGFASLTYAELPTPSTYVKGYGKPATYTNAYGAWTICAYNYTLSSAFQLNKGQEAYIGSPVMEGTIKSVVIKNVSDRTGNFIIGTNSAVSGSTVSGAFSNEGTYTYDVSSLNARQIFVRASTVAHITEFTVVWGAGSYEPGPEDPDPEPGPEPDVPVPNPDPNAKADYGWFELPAQTDKNADGIDDFISDYYYSHTFREDAPRIRNFSCCYSKSKMQPVWVAAPMHSSYKGNSGRTDAYKADPKIKCEQTSKVAGYTRGHLLGSSDRTVSAPTNRQVFYYSNIGAQLQTGFNTGGGAWNNLESLTDGQWCSDTLYQVIGCIFTTFTDKYGNTVSPKKVDNVQIPTAYYKVMLRTKGGNTGKRVDQCSASELKCAAFILAHRSNAGHKPAATDMYTVSELEDLTGLRFFVNVPNTPKETAVASDWNL